jgi:hypothetical protein
MSRPFPDSGLFRLVQILNRAASVSSLAAISRNILQAVDPLARVTGMRDNHHHLGDFRKSYVRSHNKQTRRMATGLEMSNPMPGHRMLVKGKENASRSLGPAEDFGIWSLEGKVGEIAYPHNVNRVDAPEVMRSDCAPQWPTTVLVKDEANGHRSALLPGPRSFFNNISNTQHAWAGSIVRAQFINPGFYRCHILIDVSPILQVESDYLVE